MDRWTDETVVHDDDEVVPTPPPVENAAVRMGDIERTLQNLANRYAHNNNTVARFVIDEAAPPLNIEVAFGDLAAHQNNHRFHWNYAEPVERVAPPDEIGVVANEAAYGDVRELFGRPRAIEPVWHFGVDGPMRFEDENGVADVDRLHLREQIARYNTKALKGTKGDTKGMADWSYVRRNIRGITSLEDYFAKLIDLIHNRGHWYEMAHIIEGVALQAQLSGGPTLDEVVAIYEKAEDDWYKTLPVKHGYVMLFDNGRGAWSNAFYEGFTPRNKQYIANEARVYRDEGRTVIVGRTDSAAFVAAENRPGPKLAWLHRQQTWDVAPTKTTTKEAVRGRRAA